MTQIKKVLVIVFMLVLVALVVVACETDPTPTAPPPTVVVPTASPTPFQPERPACLDGLSFGGPAVVIRVEDADTIMIKTPSGEERIDYVGVNGWNDERRNTGKAFNRELVEGKEIELALDPAVQDHNGRPAYYVFVGETFVNLEMIATGNARPRETVVDQLVCGELFRENTE